ncbi:hypothetical protein K7395_02415 [Streptomyces filamentosus]|uniref:Uncharacterized protein n=2 Tax=Streptomyces filamentosus TaxID=67294 RepID=A0ABY4UNC8_STRFL|nr:MULTISPECIES: hypothetical protein [Streptomyces]EFE79073.1 predicted protein [Streptomyces filamentosus NRRL 15998]ESU50740.1 hypothetical protein P376_1274 [Streptomyces sp. HCCB10043]EWS95929.1 hypothetical protein SSIG_06702 [Streptomyces filamentosus NRRL 11379]MYR82907.1 hypothetical protein [Streptomyces sp. SID5466]USC45660.1 hypothetical protein K7395_02415 [Streptomyces filamentosus]
MAGDFLGQGPLLLAAAALGPLSVPARSTGATARADWALSADVLLVGTAVTAALLAIEQA